jgi:uncharacterized protein YutE (UPF0331/DUF86 family)
MDLLENGVLDRFFVVLKDSLQKLRDLSTLSKDDLLGNYEKIDAAKYNFIVAIEAAIDICNRIIAQHGLGFPQDYADVVKVMGEKGVFKDELTNKLVQMVKFRNLLVHLYWKIDDERVHTYLGENLSDFEKFTKAIKNYLQSNRSN